MATLAAVTLIRHGQSEYNAAFEFNGKDPMVRDAPLTPQGQQQAETARQALAGRQYDLVITSPLSRAIQTCLTVIPPESFEGQQSPKYEVWEECRELLEASCDIGSSPAELAAKFKSAPALDFSMLPQTWWTVPEEIQHLEQDEQVKLFGQARFVETESQHRARVDAFMEKLHKCAAPGQSFVVFGHADFFHEVLLRHFGIDRWMENCEAFQVELELQA